MSVRFKHGVAQALDCLTPKQLEELNKGNEVFPDEYSGRFGLRLGPKRELWIVPSTLWIGRLKV